MPTLTRKQFNNFNKSVAATPLDASLRLVFADWLEDQGLDSAAAEQRLLGTLLNDPYDTRARWEYANWLDSRRRQKEACLHRWIVLLLKGKKNSPAMLLTHKGVVSVDDGHASVDDGYEELPTLPPLSAEQQEAMRHRAKMLFAAHPDVHLVAVGRTDPADHELDTDDREQGEPGELRSPLLYLWAGPDSVHRISGAPNIEADSLCPYCGWDAADHEAWEGCEHLVCELDEWADNPAGIERGALKGVVDKALRRLVDAVKAFVRSCCGDRKKIRSLKPKHLRPLTKAVVEECGLNPEEEDEELDVATEIQYAFEDYLGGVFRRVEKKGEVSCYDTWDRYGTCPVLYWSTDARGTAKKIKRQITEDLATVSQQTQ
jgi:uncharacterized protein (TIGR02996 family)